MDKIIPPSVQKKADYKRKEKLHKHINTILAIVLIAIFVGFFIYAIINNP